MEDKQTVCLEAVVDSYIWFWHVFFGQAGSNNDLYILDNSPLLVDLMHGRAPRVQYTINGNCYTLPYYLTDGIYPEYQIFVKTIPAPSTEKCKYFAARQEGERKEVERGFNALQVSALIFCLVDL